jgi:FlaA1/EpsC-like NDP-sugar epimerase
LHISPSPAAVFRRRRYLWLGYAQVVLDLFVLTVSFAFSFLIRFDGYVPVEFRNVALLSLPFVVTLTMVSLVVHGARRFVWRYTGLHEVARILLAVTSVSLVLVIIRLAAGDSPFFLKLPLGIIAINHFLSFFGLCSLRVTRRVTYERSKIRAFSPVQGYTRVLLVGAGDAGRIVATEIEHRPDIGLRVVGFVDDDPRKFGKRLGAYAVLGRVADLNSLVEKHRIDLVIITFSTVPSTKIREIVDVCSAIPVPVRIIPGIYEILGEHVTVSQIRDVRIEDLLAREVIQFDPASVDLLETYTGKRILVTGAGGSIGSELCRQFAHLQPSLLVMVDKDENAIFEVEMMARQFIARERLKPVILDLRREHALRRIFESYRPDVIVHAAAHKHVPLLESQVLEAFDNNVVGTDILLKLTVEFAARTFVMVSTDKAVNPTNIMGATKRLSEMLVQVAAQQSAVRVSCVRFGNVLESRGSVVPIFKKQIARGGPVTVTHPEATRFFMTIGEAAQLIIQAGSLGSRGEIFVLDMGERVKVIDLARDLIRLSVSAKMRDIPIDVIGLRPGEKLHEELFIDEEGMRATKFRKIFIAPQQPIPADDMRRAMQDIRAAIASQNEAALMGLVDRLDIGYHKPLVAEPAIASVKVQR